MRGIVVLDALVVLTASFSVDQEVAGVLELAVLALTATVVELPADGGIVVVWTALIDFAVAYQRRLGRRACRFADFLGKAVGAMVLIPTGLAEPPPA